MRLHPLAAITLLAVSFIIPAPVHAAPALQVLAIPGGRPDDIAVAHGQLVWGNLARGTVERLRGRRVVTVARGLAVPEGIVPVRGGLVVAVQGEDRVVRLRRGRVRTLLDLQPVPGQEGVDGIGRDPRSGDLLIPDSPHGTVIRTRPNGRHPVVIARNLGRPVGAAVDRHGDVLVPDEHLGTLIVIAPNGHVSRRGTFSIPDDVAVAHNGTIWVTSLGDGGLWRLRAGRIRRVLSGLADPQGLTLDRCGDPIVVEQGTARIVRLLLSSRAARCRI